MPDAVNEDRPIEEVEVAQPSPIPVVPPKPYPGFCRRSG